VPTLDITPLELATNTMLGSAVQTPPLPYPSLGTTPLDAMEAAVLPAVARPPCVITFSGGRDSSLILAVATKVARREGLPPPLPATINFVGIEAAEESSWQELVIRHLGLGEWVQRDVTTELDRLGPIATDVLSRHGVLWPLNVYVHQALIEHAAGGSLMTGMFGDTVFGGGRWLRANQVLAGRQKPGLRDGLRVGFALAPRWARARILRQRSREVPWLRPTAHEEFQRRYVEGQAGVPRRWDRWIEWYAGRRAVSISHQSMRAITGDVDALLVQPLADPGFLAALAHSGRSNGIGDRTDVMRSLFASVLPDALLARPDKARFGRAFRGGESAAFIDAWQGDGVDADLVDPEILKREWQSGVIDERSTLLLQSAWLHPQRYGV